MTKTLLARELLYLLVENYGALTFTTVDVSEYMMLYQERNSKVHLVDNPLGLTPKWLSNDLKRLYEMNLLDRKREKRPMSGLGSSNRGIQYRYWASNAGLGYFEYLRKSGFQLPLRSGFSESKIFHAVEIMPIHEADKPAMRQQLRINSRIVPPLDSRLPDWMRLQALTDGDRLYRKRVGISRRFGQRRLIANQSKQIQALQTSLAYMNPRYQKYRSELERL